MKSSRKVTLYQTTAESSEHRQKRQRIESAKVPLTEHHLRQLGDRNLELNKQAPVSDALRNGPGATMPMWSPNTSSTSMDTSSSKTFSAQKRHSHDASSEGGSLRIKHALNREFINNYCTCETMDQFLNEYVPCQNVSYPSDTGIAGAFNEVMEAKDETAMFEPFLVGVERLSKSFPKEKKLASCDTHAVQFPVSHRAHVEIKPNIVSMLPGYSAQEKEKWTWHDASLIWKMTLTEAQDPINETGQCKPTDDHAAIRIQLVKTARNLLMAHLSCFVFVIGIYGAKIRIFRFDHSGIIISPSFDYTKSPDILQKFLWRLVHPLPYNGFLRPHTIVGTDPTITRPSSQEFDGYFNRLVEKCPDLKSKKAEVQQAALLIDTRIDIEEADNNEERDDEDPGPQRDVKCLAFQILHSSTGVVGRATHVFKVLLLVDDDSSNDRICTLKDSWQQHTRWDEGHFYRRIKRLSRNQTIRAELKASLQIDLSKPGEFDKTGLAKNIGTWNLKTCIDADMFGFITQSARLWQRKSDADPKSFERSRVRSLMKNVGRPLSMFRSTKELVMALRDAVRAIELLRICGVLHRDISAGNILLLESGIDIGGFLHDLDSSTPIPSLAEKGDATLKALIEKDLKYMTGTRPFMAIDILANGNEREIHDVHHDLESIYWVAIWCILRHTKHGHLDGDHACYNLFEQKSDRLLKSMKERWLTTESQLTVPGNPPLTHLIAKLSEAFFEHLPAVQRMHRKANRSNEFVKFSELLQILYTSLSEDGWPDNDKSQPYFAPQPED